MANENRVPGALGRLAPHPEATHPRLKLSDYLNKSKLPATPSVIDWCSKVTSWPMFLNDQLGDCTCAAVGHQIQAWTEYANTEVTVTDNDILKLYEAFGYNPDDPSTDQGAVVQDVLAYMTKVGCAGNKYELYAQLDVSNMNEVDQALYLFGSVYLGIEVPQSAEDQFQNGEPWSDVGDQNILGGHAIVVQGKTSSGNLEVITWGAVQEMEQSFWTTYVEEAWAVLTPQWFSKTGNTPDGINLTQMQADFKQLYG